MHNNQFSLLTYNIAKALSLLRRRYILSGLREALHNVPADFIFLQEVRGAHPAKFKEKYRQEPLEILAQDLMPYSYYGKTTEYEDGHHGNAVLSRYEIRRIENLDISVSPFARRGLLHCVLDLPEIEKDLHLLCLHLDLLSSDRKKQMRLVQDRIEQVVDENDFVVVAGDFNDWRGELGAVLSSRLGLHEVSFKDLKKARTFPSFLPILQLDRVFYRGLEVKSRQILTGQPWARLSDHLPLLVQFGF